MPPVTLALQSIIVAIRALVPLLITSIPVVVVVARALRRVREDRVVFAPVVGGAEGGAADGLGVLVFVADAEGVEVCVGAGSGSEELLWVLGIGVCGPGGKEEG